MIREKFILKILIFIITAVFLLTGIMKLAGSSHEKELFTKWNYPLWFMYFTGVCDILFALGLLAKKLRRLSALILFLLLSTALVTNFLNKESFSLFTLICLSFIMSILYFDATETRD